MTLHITVHRLEKLSLKHFGPRRIQRIEIARELLLSSEKSIAEIGRRCGFSGASYFSECFKAHVGVTPREYRQRAK